MAGEGLVVGGYRLLRPLGAGGTGSVYEAVDGDGRHVALKVLHPHIAADPAARARLSREVSLLHRVRGAGVARVLDAEAEDAEAFVVTELVDGPTLEADVDRDGPYTPEELRGLAHGLAEALTAIHDAGVVHRDLKPSNVMLSGRGPVLIDFGIAQVADDVRLTQTGMVTGTPGYLAPEIVEGGDPSAEADWWAWAAVLAFAGTGRPPFGRGPTAAVLSRVASGNVDVAGLPENVAAMLRAALQPDPARRPDHEQVLGVLDGGELPAWLIATLEAGGAPVASGTAGPVAHLPGSGGDPPTRSMPVTPPGKGRARTRALSADRPTEGTRVLPTGRPAEVYPAPAGVDAPPGMPGYGPPGGVSGPTGAPVVYGAQPNGPAGAYEPAAAPMPRHVPADPYTYEGAPTAEVGPNTGPAPFPDAGGPVPRWALPPPRRPFLVGLAGLALSTVAVRWPGPFVVAVVALWVLLGTIGLAGASRRAARFRYGPRRGDAARMYATLPWHLVRAVLGAVPGLLLGAVAGVVAYLIGAWVLLEGLVPDLTLTAVRWVAALAALVLAWAAFRGAREGARSTIGAVLPNGGARAAAAFVLTVLLVLGLVPLVQGGVAEPDWSPLPPPPSLV